MRHLLLKAAAVAAFALAGAVGAAAEPTRVGFSPEPYPPFWTADASGKWTGWEVDIIDALCAEAKLECAYTPIPWDGLIPALTSKKIDMITVSYTHLTLPTNREV